MFAIHPYRKKKTIHMISEQREFSVLVCRITRAISHLLLYTRITHKNLRNSKSLRLSQFRHGTIQT